MVKLNQSDLDEINKTFNKLSNIDKSPILAEFADYVYQRAHKRADAHTKTGAMIKALFITRKADTYTIGVDTRFVPYALFVHWGTKKHEIKPKKRQYLRWSSGGKFVFSKEVHHPGYKGDTFLTLALDDGLKKLPHFFERLIKDL